MCYNVPTKKSRHLLDRDRKTSRGTTVFIVSLVSAMLALLLSEPVRADEQEDAFEETLRLAKAYDRNEPPAGVEKDVERALEYYRRALELRPDHPDNMPILVRIGGELLSMEGNREKQMEGLAIYEDILERFDYMDYYEAFPIYRSSAQQYKMITVAIYAGDYAGEPEKARSFYFKGMEMLNQTYWRRLEDWLNEPCPPRPEEGSFTNEIEIAKWKSCVGVWEQRQQAAKSGEIFHPAAYEVPHVSSLIRKYGETYGGHLPEEVPSILAPIIEAFPGSPFEKEAQRIIDNAMSIANANAAEAVQEDLDSIEPDLDAPPETQGASALSTATAETVRCIAALGHENAPNDQSTKTEYLSHGSSRADDVSFVAENWPRINEQIEALKQESMAESLERLSYMSMYDYPGAPDDGSGSIIFALPLTERSGEQAVVHSILSNRRIRKVFAELRQLDPAEASKIVASSIRTALEQRRPMFAHAADAAQTGGNPNILLLHNDLIDGAPTISGLNHQILSLALIAGNLQLKDSAPAIKDLVQEAMTERNTLYAGDDASLKTRSPARNPQSGIDYIDI